MPGHDIIVIGGSAGGLEGLRALVRLLPRDLPAALFVVLHIPADRKSAQVISIPRDSWVDIPGYAACGYQCRVKGA